MEYGASPSRFVPLWKRVYTSVKSIANKTDMIWSPNAGNSYPWAIRRNTVSAQDFALLDTNKNGEMVTLFCYLIFASTLLVSPTTTNHIHKHRILVMIHIHLTIQEMNSSTGSGLLSTTLAIGQ